MRARGALILSWLQKPWVMFLLLIAFGVGLAFDANAATGTIAALALIGGILTLSHGDATARRTRTAEYRARWEHPELLDARVATTEFLTLSDADEEVRWSEWTRWVGEGRKTKTRLQVMTILNFWEEVGSAYNQDLLDQRWFRTDLAWLLEQNWERAGWLIRRFRTEDQNAGFFCEWQIAVESVAEDLRLQAEAGRKRATNAASQGDDLLYVDQGNR